jgi:hypothetical protein
MSKKKSKRTNTFLKSKDKKSKVSSPKLISPNTYGCDEVKKEELPLYVKKIISKMGLPNPIKVPIRKRGMTSSGMEYNCHSNVVTIKSVYGGKRMIGYNIGEKEGRMNLMSHSLWITPENELVDVTKKHKEQNLWKINKGDLDFQYFIPLLELKLNEEKEFGFDSVTIHKKYKRYGYKIVSVEKDDWEKGKNLFPNLKDLFREKKVYFEKELVDRGLDLVEDDGSITSIEKDDIEQMKVDRKKKMEDCFSLPSLFTGKRISVDISSITQPLLYTNRTKDGDLNRLYQF